MYAILKTGGRQYEAKPGQIIKVGKIPGKVGENVSLGEVLLFSEGDQLQIGRPFVEGVAVKATIVEQGRMPKIVIFKHKRRKDYRKKQGHRQDFTAVRVENIG